MPKVSVEEPTIIDSIIAVLPNLLFVFLLLFVFYNLIQFLRRLGAAQDEKEGLGQEKGNKKILERLIKPLRSIDNP